MSCITFQDQLEAFVDDELAADEAALLEGHAGVCSACAEDLALAQDLRAELRSMSEEKCPEHVFEAARRRAAATARDRDPIRLPVRSRWYVATAAMAVLGLALGLLLLRPAQPEVRYTAAEVIEARQQVELAFALIGETARDVSVYLREDVFADHVFEPMRRDLGAH